MHRAKVRLKIANRQERRKKRQERREKALEKYNKNNKSIDPNDSSDSLNEINGDSSLLEDTTSEEDPELEDDLQPSSSSSGLEELEE